MTRPGTLNDPFQCPTPPRPDRRFHDCHGGPVPRAPARPILLWAPGERPRAKASGMGAGVGVVSFGLPSRLADDGKLSGPTLLAVIGVGLAAAIDLFVAMGPRPRA